MELSKEETRELFRALKILESGEILLGIDIDKQLIGKLIKKLDTNVNKDSKDAVENEVKKLIKECEKQSINKA